MRPEPASKLSRASRDRSYYNGCFTKVRCVGLLLFWRLRPSPIFFPFSVVRPTQNFGIFKKEIDNDVVKPFVCHIRVSVTDPFSHVVLR